MKKLISRISVFGLTVLAVSCGSGSSSQVTAISNTAVVGASPTGLNLCSSGSYNPTGISAYGCHSGSFSSACQSVGGVVQTNSGAQVCRVVLQYSSMSFSQSTPVARLNSEGDSENSPENSGIQVFRGDVVAVSGVSGGWSTTQDGCNDYPIASDTNGVDTQLMMTEGVGVYPVTSDGNNSGAIMMAGNGSLMFGLNIPDNEGTSGCDSLSISTVQLQRCMDASNNSYPCQ